MTEIFKFPTKRKAGWAVKAVQVVAVVPLNDIQNHDENSVWCKCHPHFKWDNGPVLVHYAFDGRE